MLAQIEPVLRNGHDRRLNRSASLSDRRRQLLAVDRLAGIENGQSLDEVLELAYIAGPRVRGEAVERGLREGDRRTAFGFAAPHEIADERRKIVEALAQRRNGDRKHVESEEEVLAELAGGRACLEIAMRGRENTHVGAALLAAADALEGAFLQDAQQLHLHVEAHVTDLIEEQRTAVGKLEAADARRQGAREGTLLVTE
jgi:hypothetical protein